MSYVWSPDGKWMVLRTDDADFNGDVWIARPTARAMRFN